MRKSRQEANASKYAAPSLWVLQYTADVLTASGEITWSWGEEFEQSRENTWQGTEG